MWKANVDPEFSAGKDTPMEARLGSLTIVLTALFGSGLLVSMGRAAWHPPYWQYSVIAFFAFGVPMVALGAATYQLWKDEFALKVKFGWLCAAAGLVWAVALFCLITEWVKIVSFRPEPITFVEGVCLFIGFAIPALVCGATGVTIVVESDK